MSLLHIILLAAFLTVLFCVVIVEIRKSFKYKRDYNAFVKPVKQQIYSSVDVSADAENTLQSEIEWRKDDYKKTFSTNDVVTFYEVDGQNITKSYMIVDSFAAKQSPQGMSIGLLPVIMYSSRDNMIITAKEAKSYYPELVNKDFFYDATKYEIEDFIEKIKERDSSMTREISILEERKREISRDGSDWWKHKNLAESYMDE